MLFDQAAQKEHLCLSGWMKREMAKTCALQGLIKLEKYQERFDMQIEFQLKELCSKQASLYGISVSEYVRQRCHKGLKT